jgi:drug/metabolite transporter (DMT)-like permease
MIVAGAVCCCIAPLNAGVSWVGAVKSVSIVGVFYLAVIGSLAFAAYNYLLLVEPAQRISSYALVNPFIATIIGVVLAREKPVAGLWVSLCAITVGVVLLVYGRAIMDFALKRGNYRGKRPV